MKFEILNRNELLDCEKCIKTKRAILYFKEDKLVKVFNTDPYLSNHSNNNLTGIVNYQTIETQENILKEISKINEEEFVLPNRVLYKKRVDTQNLIGYDMTNLKYYSELEEYLETNDISFNDRKKLSEKLCEIFTGLEKYKISYWDIHARNIMINGESLKVVDMDSVTAKETNGAFSYRVDLSCSYYNLSSLILSILYNINEEYLLKKIKSGRINSLLKKNELFKNVIEFDGKIIYPIEYLNDFTEDYVKETRRLILKR